MNSIAFGPVPSRRLGRSIGINTIPPEIKICSFSCVYCQLGRECRMSKERREFYSPEEVYRDVKQKMEAVKAKNERVDYLTIVPDGEPTLDIHLNEIRSALQEFGVPLAIITNATLLTNDDVFRELLAFDLVSLKLDAAIESVWHKVDRPVKGLNFEEHLKAMKRFAEVYQGKLITESMLIKDFNTAREDLSILAQELKTLKPFKAYISVPTRPTAIPEAMPATEEQLNMAYNLFIDAGLKTELLTGYEGNEFSSTGDPRNDILAITAVHPMREDALIKFLKDNNEKYALIEKMLQNDELYLSDFDGMRYFSRRLKSIG